MTTKTIIVVTDYAGITGSYTVPADFGSVVSVEIVGLGGSGTGYGGAGGGGYAKSTSVTGLVANGTAY